MSNSAKIVNILGGCGPQTGVVVHGKLRCFRHCWEDRPMSELVIKGHIGIGGSVTGEALVAQDISARGTI